MALDPNTLDPTLDPYVAWASQQPQPLQVQTPDYSTATGMLPPPIPLNPPPPPPPQKFDRTTGPTTDELRAGKVDADSDADVDTTAKGDTDVDAVSGAAPAATVADIGRVSYEPQPVGPNYLAPDYYEHTAQQIAGEPLPSLQTKKADELGQDEAKAIAGMSQDQYTQFKANREGAVLAKQAELQHQANIDAMDRARQERDDYLAAIQKADADSKEVAQRAQLLANTKINPDRYTQNRGVLGTLRDFTSILLTGLGGNAQLGLQQFNRRVDADIDAQKSDLANAWQGVNARRTAIGDELAHHGDMYKAQETYRLAAYQAQINDVQTQLQQFDPQGATAIRGRDALDQLHAAQQQALIAFNQQQLKNEIDIAKSNRETALANETMRHNRAQEGIEYGKLSLEKGKVAAENQIYTPEQLKQLYGADMPIPPIPMSSKQYGAWLETGKKGQESLKATRENAMQETGTLLRNPVTQEVITGKDSKPVRAGTVEDAIKQNEKIGTAQTFVDVLSKTRRMLDADPSSIDRSTWQTIKTDMEQAKVAYIQAHGAKPSSREMQAVEEMFGPDFDSFTKRLTSKGKGKAAIDALLEGTQRELDNEMGSKYGASVKLLDTSKPPPAASTPADKVNETLSSDLHQKSINEISPEDIGFLAAENPHNVPDGYRVAEDAKGSPEVQRAISVGVAPSKLKIFDQLQTEALGFDDKKRADALAALAQQATGGLTPQLRAYAQKVLTDVSSASIAASAKTYQEEP